MLTRSRCAPFLPQCCSLPPALQLAPARLAVALSTPLPPLSSPSSFPLLFCAMSFTRRTSQRANRLTPLPGRQVLLDDDPRLQDELPLLLQRDSHPDRPRGTFPIVPLLIASFSHNHAASRLQMRLWRQAQGGDVGPQAHRDGRHPPGGRAEGDERRSLQTPRAP